jgi:hypothetical protein
MPNTPYASAVARSLSDKLGEKPSVKDFGAKGDGIQLTDAAITAADKTLTSATAAFTASDVGNICVVQGAGSAGTNLFTTIASVTSETEVELADAAGTTVTVAIATYGADDTAAILAAIASMATTKDALDWPGGIYIVTETLSSKENTHWIGRGFRQDNIFYSRLQQKNYTVIASTANPAIEVQPYPGTIIENIHFHGLGTETDIELFEVASYDKQVLVWAGRIDKPLLTTATDPVDYYNTGGAGVLYLRHCGFSGAENVGWGFYAYKLNGQSVLENLNFYHVGQAVDGDCDHYGAMSFQSDSVDITARNIHIICENIGTAIKCGSKKTESDALDRFYLGPAHLKFDYLLIEGSGEFAVREYHGIGNMWSNITFGQLNRVEIGESPFVSDYNIQTIWTNISSFFLGGVYLKARRILIDNWIAEGDGTTPFYYWYSGPRITGKRIALCPTGDKTESDWILDPLYNTPCAFSDQKLDSENLIPDFDSAAWTFTPGAPEAYRETATQYKLYDSGEIKAAVGGLIAGEVYSIGFRLKVMSIAYAHWITYTLTDDSATVILANQMGLAEVVTGTEYFILFQFVAPASGAILFSVKNEDGNQVEVDQPVLLRGPHTQASHLGYHWGVDMGTSEQGGWALPATMDNLAWRRNVTASGSAGPGASLVGRAANSTDKHVAIGLNTKYDGTHWISETDKMTNAFAALLASYVNGQVRLIIKGSTGAAPQKLTHAQLLDSVRWTMNEVGSADTYGVAGQQTVRAVKKSGATSASNVQYTEAHLDNGTDLWLHAYDGTAWWFYFKALYGDDKSVILNGAKITKDGAILPCDDQDSDCGLYAGTISPEGAKTAYPGSLYLQSNGTVWRKRTGAGNTGWLALGADDVVFGTITVEDTGEAGVAFVKVKAGSGQSTTALLEGQNAGGTKTFGVNADGDVICRKVDATGAITAQNHSTGNVLLLKASGGTELFAIDNYGYAYILNGLTIGSIGANKAVVTNGDSLTVGVTGANIASQALLTSLSATASGAVPTAIDTTGMSGDILTLANKINDIISALGAGGTVVRSVSVAAKNLATDRGIVTGLA